MVIITCINQTQLQSSHVKTIEEPIILQPSLSNPFIINQGNEFTIIIRNAGDSNILKLLLTSEFVNYTLDILETVTLPTYTTYRVDTPDLVIPQLYGILIEYSGFIVTSTNSVMIEPSNNINEDITFIHLTDIHIDGSQNRTNDMKELINEINLIHPNFALLTGDVIEGLINISNQIMSGNEQYPIVINLLKELKVPILVINGNHDITINDYMNGTELWENYFLPIDFIIKFEYKNLLFVGASTYDIHGLTEDQLKQINNIFEAETEKAKFFFAHSDYDNDQFLDIYNQNDVTASFLGHEHLGSVDLKGSTLEIITDNTMTLIPNEPGHFRICTFANNSLIKYPEIESFRLNSNISEEKISDNILHVNGFVKNDLSNYTFPRLQEEIVLKDFWEVQDSENVSSFEVQYNQSHTKLIVELESVQSGFFNYSLNLSKITLTTTETSSTEQSTTTSTVISSTHSTTTILPENSKPTSNASLIFYLIAIWLLSLKLMKKRK